MPKSYTVNAAFGMKVPGAADFSSQEARLGIEITLDSAENVDDAIEEILAAETMLKLAVLEELGVGFTTNDSGVIQPDFSTLPKRASAAPPASNGGGQKNYQSRGGPRTNNGPKNNVDTYQIFLNGEQRVVMDLRPLKADGTYKPTSPNFKLKLDGGEVETVWPKFKDGRQNPLDLEIAQLVDALISPM